MINGEAIAGQAIGDAGLRRFATEQSGPRPAGTAAALASGDQRSARPERAGPAARATRP